MVHVLHRGMRVALVAVPLLVSLTIGSTRAVAQTSAPITTTPPLGATIVPVEKKTPPVAWSSLWPRFRLWEYAGTAAVFGVSLFIRFREPLPAQPHWQGRNPVDDTIRSWLVARTPQGRAEAGTASDWISLVGTAWPYAVDLPVTLIGHRTFDVTWQLLMMDLEAASVAGFFNNLAFFTVGRGRPTVVACMTDPNYDRLCGGTGNNASFPSGHTLTIATSTGLVCAHHRYLPLYGSTAADRAACILLALGTAATATARIISDRHYASDALVGAAIGFGSGYGLPWLLHYRTGLRPEADKGLHVALIPFAARESLGLGLIGEL
jgi:membrane-associated phospholipid phosphatase